MLSTFVVLVLTAWVPSESALVRPVVTFTPPWRRILSGDSLTIACDIGTAAQEDETFYWYRNEKPIGVHQQNFTVQSASEVYNGGDYQCRTSTSDISDPVKLNVRYAYMVLQKPPYTYEGDPLTLRCYSPPEYNGTDTTFYKDGAEIQFSVNNSDLHIDKVDRSATGTYRCTKTVEFGMFLNVSSETYVYVRGDEVKPTVTFTPNWMRVLSMDSVTLTCNVASADQEKETFNWYKDEKPLNIQTQNFTIQSATWRQDFGFYQCRSDTSDISEPVNLDVRSDLILQRPPSIYEGDPLTLRCLSSSSFHVINTTFYKDDKKIKFSNSDTELHIDKVDRSMTGVYKCAQRSKRSGPNGDLAAYKTFSTYITVRAVIRPVVTLTPSWGNLLSGDSVTLSCDPGSAVQDHQTFYWYKDEKVLDIAQQNITIPSASPRDGGEYKCRTRSSDMSYPIRLEVSDADVILQQDASSPYEGSPLTLRCHRRSVYNGINTTFYKEDRELQFSANDSTLQINQLDRRATGNYKCSQLLQSQDGAFPAHSAQIYIHVKAVMLDPGEDPGGGPLERPKPQAEAMDGPGPRRGEPLSAFRRRVNDMLLRIAKEEEKLGRMRLEYRRKKLQYDKVWNTKKQILQPELEDLEQALERQSELVNSLKENSGAFKEKFENEKRFRRMRSDTRLHMDSGNPELSEAAEMSVRGESVPEKGACSPVSPKTAETPAMEVSVLLPPQQPCVSSQQEVEEGAGMLELITEMESPLSGRSFWFSAGSSDEDGEVDTVPHPAKERPAERMRFTRSALKDGGSTTSTGQSAGSSMKKSSVRPEKEKPQKTKEECEITRITGTAPSETLD